MFDERQYLIDNGYIELELETTQSDIEYRENMIIGKYNKLCLNCHIETGSYLNYCSVDCLHKELGDSDG